MPIGKNIRDGSFIFFQKTLNNPNTMKATPTMCQQRQVQKLKLVYFFAQKKRRKQSVFSKHKTGQVKWTS